MTGTVTTNWGKGPGNTQVDEGAIVAFDTPRPAVPIVRRLTPLECERLQGFPDNWTSHGTYGADLLIPDTRPIADTHRYRMMGNAVTVPVFQWVAERIARYR